MEKRYASYRPIYSKPIPLTGQWYSGVQNANVSLAQFRQQQTVVNSMSQIPVELMNNNSYTENSNGNLLSYNSNVFDTNALKSTVVGSSQTQNYGYAIHSDFLNAENLNLILNNGYNISERGPMVKARDFSNNFVFDHTQTGINNVISEQPTIDIRNFPIHGHFNEDQIHNCFQRPPLVDRIDFLNRNNRFQHVQDFENLANNNHPKQRDRKEMPSSSTTDNVTQSIYSKYSIFNLKPKKSPSQFEPPTTNQITKNIRVQPITQTDMVCQTTRGTSNQYQPMRSKTIRYQPIKDVDDLKDQRKNSTKDVMDSHNWYKNPIGMYCTESNRKNGKECYQQTMAIDNRGNSSSSVCESGLIIEIQQYEGSREKNFHEIEGTNGPLARHFPVGLVKNQNQEDDITFNETTTNTCKYSPISDVSDTDSVTENINIQLRTSPHYEICTNVDSDSIQNIDNAQQKSSNSEILDNVTRKTTDGTCIVDKTLDIHQKQEDHITFNETTTYTCKYSPISDVSDTDSVTENIDIQLRTKSHNKLCSTLDNDSIQNIDNAQQKLSNSKSLGNVAKKTSKGTCIADETNDEETDIKPQNDDKYHTTSSVESIKHREKSILETSRNIVDRSDKSECAMRDVVSCLLSQFYVIFHKKKLLCFGKGKYLFMREFLHKFFDKDEQKKVYKLKMELKIPFASLPDKYRNGTLKYLKTKGIGGRNPSFIGLVRIHQANRLYHIMSGSKDCKDCCVRLYKSKKEFILSSLPSNTENDYGGKLCPSYSFPTTVRSPDEGYESVDASPYSDETTICDPNEGSVDVCSKEKEPVSNTCNIQDDNKKTKTLNMCTLHDDSKRTKPQVPDMFISPDDRMYKGGLLELFNKTLRYIEIYEDKYLPLCDVAENFDRSEVSASIRKGNINVFRCTHLEAGYLNQFTEFKDIEPDDEIVHERLLHHIYLRPATYTKADTTPIIGDTG